MKSCLIFLLLLLNGCSQYSIRNIDRPPPEDYETWEKQSNSIAQVKMALLECGAIAPSTLGWAYRSAYEKIGIFDERDQTNHGFLVDRCMLAAGYKQKMTRLTVKDLCSLDKHKALPACQPDAIISTPSVEHRLNSWYCKVKSDYNYCLEHALAPQLCTPEKAKNPPPECLEDD